MSVLARYISPHLRKPSTGFWGWLVRKLLQWNTPTAKATFDKLEVTDDDVVLELGFGYGYGLSYALEQKIRSGSGKLYAVDYSATVCDAVRQLLPRDVDAGKLVIYEADVAKMPIDDEAIDKVFHTNCFYFWPDIAAATAEIKRVMKPGGLMVTGMEPIKVERAERNGFLQNCQCKPDVYMGALQDAGFESVRMDTVESQPGVVECVFIYASKPSPSQQNST